MPGVGNHVTNMENVHGLNDSTPESFEKPCTSISLTSQFVVRSQKFKQPPRKDYFKKFCDGRDERWWLCLLEVGPGLVMIMTAVSKKKADHHVASCSSKLWLQTGTMEVFSVEISLGRLTGN